MNTCSKPYNNRDGLDGYELEREIMEHSFVCQKENPFYEEYHKIIPIKEGFEKRIIIYNFYHILNHANMFGGSYFYQVQDYAKKILNL